ncbi:MAG TPA: 1,4-dihydroxy-2-naphthoate polyprenyltransferase [Limnochordales bacterium]
MLAARIPTLSAAVAPVLVGTAMAAARGAARADVFLAALAASLLIQIGTNFANDLFDYRKGADREGRLGPTRVTQTGLLSEAQVARGTLTVFAGAVLLGAYLARVGGWPVVVIGALAIAAGVLYTAGPWPLGYHGLGDVMVFLFFGVVAVGGTVYVHAGQWPASALVAGAAVGCTVTAILVVNNLRDLEQDRASGKRTLAVRLGVRGTRVEYVVLVAAAYGLWAALWRMGELGPAFWLPLLSLPWAADTVRQVFTQQGRALNATLKGTSRLHLAFSALLALSFVLGR